MQHITQSASRCSRGRLLFKRAAMRVRHRAQLTNRTAAAVLAECFMATVEFAQWSAMPPAELARVVDGLHARFPQLPRAAVERILRQSADLKVAEEALGAATGAADAEARETKAK